MDIKPHKTYAFTLVEIMIVVAVIGILAVIAIPNFVNARLKARESICMNNMRQIDSAKEQWALENGKATTDTPSPAEVSAYIRSGFPECPSNGTYTIEDLSTLPRCSEHGIFPYPINP